MDYLQEISTMHLLLVLISAFLVGTSKAGIKGVGLVIVPVMASVFGARASTGIVLPMLIMADILAVIYYRKSVQWKYIRKLIPWALAGVLVGVFVGELINEVQFRLLLGGIIIIMLILLVLNDYRKGDRIPDNWIFASVMGLAGGFTTMVGNAAGPVFSIYLLAMKLPKKEFIGTGAWFFFIINILKVPFHVFSWKTIDLETLELDLVLFPVAFLGMLGGIYLVKLFPEKIYRYFVIVMTSLAAAFMFIG